MRRSLPIFITGLIVACYLGVAGVGVAPYYAAVSSFITSATNNSEAGSSAPTKTSAQLHATKTATHPVVVRPTATPLPRAVQTRLRNEAVVQHIAQSTHPPTGRINILLLGSDNDAKIETAKSPDTQVMIVLSFDTVAHTVTILSIPRDFWVRIPGYTYNTGPNGVGPIGWSKIDVSAELGFNSAACAVEYNFHIPIDHWIWVGLKGFQGVVNTVDGVTLDVTYPVIDDTYPDDINTNDPYGYRRIYIPPGPQHLNGDDALHYVRSRHGDVSGDFGRSARQQVVLTQLRRVLLGQGGSALVALAPSLFADLNKEVKTDLTPDLSTAVTYYELLRSISGTTPKQVILQPPTYSSDGFEPDYDPRHKTGGQPESTVEPNWATINPEIVKLFGGRYFKFAKSHCASVPGATQ